MSSMENELIEHGTDLKKNQDHINDSINLLAFIFLLILVILTVWLFKHKHFPYIHYTGLAIIYGLIFGIIIRYSLPMPKLNSINLKANNLSITDIRSLPDIIHLSISSVSNISENVFVYGYKSPKKSFETDPIAEKASFDPEIFFNILLPPIIFNAGYSMKKKHFFKNFGAILTFALLGTVISCFITGGLTYMFVSMFKSLKEYFSFQDSLYFGALISATDPVTVLAIFNDQKINVNLYAIVFGESVLNDAVSITLASAIEKYSGTFEADKFDMNQFFQCIHNFFSVFFAAFSIGALMGCVTALITKFTFIRQHSMLETALFVLMSYSTFLASEAAGFTGIISVLFCGIFQAHYTYNNLSDASKAQTKDLFHLLNFLSENFIFIYIGVTMFTFRNHKWEISFISWSFFAIIIARAFNIYLLSFLINITRSKKNKIEYNMQHLMVFSGLRGAMAFALAIRNTSSQARKLILTTTSIIVILTVIICGGLTNKLIIWLQIKTGPVFDEESSNNNEEIKSDELIIDDNHKSKFKLFLSKFALFKAWHCFDNNFMKPLLTNSVPALTETMPKLFAPITKVLTTKEQVGNKNLMNESNYNELNNSITNDNNNIIVRNRSSLNSNEFVNPFEFSEPEL